LEKQLDQLKKMYKFSIFYGFIFPPLWIISLMLNSRIKAKKISKGTVIVFLVHTILSTILVYGHLFYTYYNDFIEFGFYALDFSLFVVFMVSFALYYFLFIYPASIAVRYLHSLRMKHESKDLT
jgi:hypothetical protein